MWQVPEWDSLKKNADVAAEAFEKQNTDFLTGTAMCACVCVCVCVCVHVCVRALPSRKFTTMSPIPPTQLSELGKSFKGQKRLSITSFKGQYYCKCFGAVVMLVVAPAIAHNQTLCRFVVWVGVWACRPFAQTMCASSSRIARETCAQVSVCVCACVLGSCCPYASHASRSSPCLTPPPLPACVCVWWLCSAKGRIALVCRLEATRGSHSTRRRSNPVAQGCEGVMA